MIDNIERKYVEATYTVLKNEGAEAVRVRKISDMVNCSAAALYKHFESLDYLVVLASCEFLNDYILELLQVINYEDDPIDINLQAWDIFNRHAFHNPIVYEQMFFGKFHRHLDNALYEYFQLFPERLYHGDRKFDAFAICGLFNGSLEERDFLWLKRAANKGRLTFDDAQYISKIDCFIIRGMLLEHMQDYKEPRVAQSAAKQCTAMIEKLVLKHLLY